MCCSLDVADSGVPEWAGATRERRSSLPTAETAQDTLYHHLSQLGCSSLGVGSGELENGNGGMGEQE